jgi:Tol biopolymer transport system component
MVRLCAAVVVVAAGCGRFGFGSSQITDGDGAVEGDGATADAMVPICHTGTWGTPEPIASTVTASEEAYPSISDDELTLYYSSNRSPSQARALWFTKRGSKTQPFGIPERMVEIDDLTDDRDPAISSDGDTLYFSSKRTGMDAIFVASRAGGDTFTLDGPVTFQNDIVAFPRYAPDLDANAAMVFAHDLDVGIATRIDKATYSFDREFDELNAPQTDGSPSITADGLELFFESYRTGTAAIFVATRSDTSMVFSNLTELTNLPAGMLAAGTPEISRDGATLYYFINTGTQLDLYSVRRSCD